MKIRFIPTAIALLIFVIATALTYQNEAASDGYIQAGFPFLFYKNTPGKLTDPAYRSQLGFQPVPLVIDVAMMLLFILLVNVLYQEVFNKSTSRSGT